MIRASLIRTAVIGHPISHSKSPLIHNYWIKKYSLEGSYEPVEIAPENLAQGVEDLCAQGFAGFNVTAPHKEKIMPLCKSIDFDASKVGAVNTVIIEPAGLRGINTDVFGFTQNILESVPGFDFTAGPAVVLGAGGAALAVVLALLEQTTPEILVLNRTRANAEKMAFGHTAVKVHDWSERNAVISNANILINATSLGMKGQEPLEIDLKKLPRKALVHDIVYAPLETDLLKQARSRGNPVVTGIGMLLHQARPSFKAWYGVMPDVDNELKALVLR